jgi:hypothetical protein
MSDSSNDFPQVAIFDLEDADAAVGLIEFFINRPKVVKIEIIKTGHVYTGEIAVPAPEPEPPA